MFPHYYMGYFVSDFGPDVDFTYQYQFFHGFQGLVITDYLFNLFLALLFCVVNKIAKKVINHFYSNIV